MFLFISVNRGNNAIVYINMIIIRKIFLSSQSNPHQSSQYPAPFTMLCYLHHVYFIPFLLPLSRKLMFPCFIRNSIWHHQSDIYMLHRSISLFSLMYSTIIDKPLTVNQPNHNRHLFFTTIQTQATRPICISRPSRLLHAPKCCRILFAFASFLPQLFKQAFLRDIIGTFRVFRPTIPVQSHTQKRVAALRERDVPQLVAERKRIPTQDDRLLSVNMETGTHRQENSSAQRFVIVKRCVTVELCEHLNGMDGYILSGEMWTGCWDIISPLEIFVKSEYQ